MKPFAKSALSGALALLLSTGAALPALAYEEKDAQNKADILHTMSLFQGTDKGYELEKSLTRMEALIMLIRLSGEEYSAIYPAEEYTHPFTDAPEWENAGDYIGYAYQTGLTAGISDTEFAPELRASLRTYATFVLRALGYTEEKDQVWENWETLAQEAGILPEGVDSENFRRGDAVLISYAALNAKMAESEETLAEKLTEEGAVTPLTLAMAKAMAGEAVTPDSSFTDILGQIYAGVDTVRPAGLMVTDISADQVSYFLGTDAETISFVEGVACEPMMTSQAHSVCLARVAEGTDMEMVKKEIREKVNPQKWICVGVDPSNIRVENMGNLVLLVMDNRNPDALADNFRKMNPEIVRADEKGMLYVDGAYIAADEYVNASSVAQYAAKLNTLRETYFPENPVYYATIPEKSYYVRDKAIGVLNHDSITGILAESLYDWKTVELSDCLTLEDYYATDRHWRQEKLEGVVKALSERMGFTVSEPYETHTAENFKGDYQNAVSDIEGEPLIWMTNRFTQEAVVEDFQNPGVKTVYNEEKLTTKTPYDVFLSGATPLTVIENKNAPEKRELVLFRDSYGGSIAPLLIEGYSKITLVDLRYMASSLLGDYVDFEGADILFLMCDKVVNNSVMLK